MRNYSECSWAEALFLRARTCVGAVFQVPFLGWVTLASFACAAPLHAQTLDLPQRPMDAPGGSEIARELRGLDLGAREARIYEEIARGNVPSWLRRLSRVEVTREVHGDVRKASFWVTPDYVSVGSDDDYFLVPLSPQTGQRIADLVGASLPTPVLVDAVWAAADVRLGNDSIPPGPEMTTVRTFEDHDRRVRDRRAAFAAPSGALIAGHKKDVVLALELSGRPGHVAIYGWHRPDGRPIQPLYTGHTDRWVDYSHGIRLVQRAIEIDGIGHDLVDVLGDAELSALVSDEGRLMEPRYPRAAAQEIHRLPLRAENIHWGYYDGALDPVLTVESGDHVYFENLLARGLERPRMAGISPSRFLPSMLAVEEEETERGGSHPLTGPIHVAGAEPGHVLEVHFLDIGFLAPFGVSAFRPGGGALPDDFTESGLRAFEIDTMSATATMVGVDGVTIPVRPFFGSVGVAPPLTQGRINSTAPGRHVGNLDNKELVEGSTLYLPVHVPGGLLSIGDGHAAQGDGEVSGTAIESSLYGTVQIVLRTDLTLEWARAETPTHYISMGLDPDLDVAAEMATRQMIAWLVDERGMDAGDAYVLCSVALDLRVTQLVDGTKGVHGMLAKDLFR